MWGLLGKWDLLALRRVIIQSYSGQPLTELGCPQRDWPIPTRFSKSCPYAAVLPTCLSEFTVYGRYRGLCKLD